MTLFLDTNIILDFFWSANLSTILQRHSLRWQKKKAHKYSCQRTASLPLNIFVAKG